MDFGLQIEDRELKIGAPVDAGLELFHITASIGNTCGP